MRIAKTIGSEIDQLAYKLFSDNRLLLLAEPITYIIPAIWGASANGPLTVEQKRIHNQVIPVLDDAVDSFDASTLNEAQIFALTFIIRGLLISKVTYMIESFKNHAKDKLGNTDDDLFSLKNVEPHGEA